jgi:uncharacterized RDD family membrane protein YckC
MTKPALNPFAPPLADIEHVVAVPPGQVALASRGRRFGGSLLDGLLFVPSMVLGTISAMPPFSLQAPSRGLKLASWTWMLLVWILQWVLVTRTGQTVGKRALGMKIVRVDGAPLNFVSGVVLRYWIPLAIQYGVQFVVKLLSVGVFPTAFLSIVWPLADPLAIFGEERRCLHDHVAGTKVIEVKR